MIKTVLEKRRESYLSEWKLTGFLYQKATEITVHIFKNNYNIARKFA